MKDMLVVPIYVAPEVVAKVVGLERDQTVRFFRRKYAAREDENGERVERVDMFPRVGHHIRCNTTLLKEYEFEVYRKLVQELQRRVMASSQDEPTQGVAGQ